MGIALALLLSSSAAVAAEEPQSPEPSGIPLQPRLLPAELPLSPAPPVVIPPPDPPAIPTEPPAPPGEPAPSVGPHGVAPTPAKRWRASLGLGGVVLFDGRRSTVVGGADADIYLRPLVDDPEAPLALLPYLQHPSTISLSAGRSVGGGGGQVAATIFVFAKTALGAQFGAEYDPDILTFGAGGSAFVLHYFTRKLRGSIGYAGSRQWNAAQTVTSDGARLTMGVLFGRVLLGSRLDVSLNSFSSFVVAPKLVVDVLVSRRWTVELEGDASWITFASPSGNTTLTEQRVGAAVVVYLTDALRLEAGWSTSFRQVPAGLIANPSAPFTLVAPIFHAVGLKLGVRI